MTHPHLGPPLEGEDEKSASRTKVPHLGPPLEGEDEKSASRTKVPHLGPPLEGEDEKSASRKKLAHLGPPLVAPIPAFPRVAREGENGAARSEDREDRNSASRGKQTMAEKLLSRHNLAGGPVHAGDILEARIDGAMCHYH